MNWRMWQRAVHHALRCSDLNGGRLICLLHFLKLQVKYRQYIVNARIKLLWGWWISIGFCGWTVVCGEAVVFYIYSDNWNVYIDCIMDWSLASATDWCWCNVLLATSICATYCLVHVFVCFKFDHKLSIHKDHALCLCVVCIWIAE